MIKRLFGISMQIKCFIQRWVIDSVVLSAETWDVCLGGTWLNVVKKSLVFFSFFFLFFCCFFFFCFFFFGVSDLGL